ncbi:MULTISPECIES: glycoside hydrolase family 6 protein [Streptomyces]|uniref:glycoside hydrolase family 6 protein n=1 Tax=Streptomyces TaxID=1883 RepID=UPI001E43B8EF|nr:MULTISPECIES: glycoside hydrolase family 6 protein [Streptomyces]UFQ15827.1 glycoside hydrolase family 6 protein [Streptomyces huasconensis]WCL85431.1 glycoside hydrolase family 6 protein [Streptomyces sp. JCM 35825]
MYRNDTGRGRRSVARGVRTGVVLAGAALLLSACSSSGGDPGENASGPPAEQQPRSKNPYWVNPEGNAARQVTAYEKDGERDDAELIRRIARRPVAEWLVPENAEDQARGFTEAAEKAGRDALLVLYNIPHRDCGQYSGGGAADGDAYRAFVDEVARGIGDRRATVILEPDAVLHMVDNCTPEQFHEERYDLLGGAIEKLTSLKNTKVYLDAGNAGWQNPDSLWEPLKRSGVERADGFSVNVANFQTTEASTEYGKKLSAKIGGKPFVIDTGRNGNGPYDKGKDPWCNPPGRALGEEPTTETGDPLVDAYLWIKRPGESDGTCRGGPKAGEWWPEYALGLAKNAG